MKYFIGIGLLCLCLIAGCVTPYKPVSDKSVEVLSNYPIQSVNGESAVDPFKVLLPPGQYTLVVRFPTYLHNYDCAFTVNLKHNTRYEVVNANRELPLVLYRWNFVNRFWSSRREATTPEFCEIFPAEINDSTAH